MEATSQIGIDEIVEAEKQLLLEKNNALEAKVDSLQGQIGELQARLKVVELEAKLANKQLDKRIEAKVAELIDQLTEKLMSKTKEKIKEQDRKINVEMELMTSKMAEEDEKMKKEICDVMQEKDKRMDEVLADLGGKMATLENQTADGKNKLEEFALKLVNLETKTKNVWNNNRWNASDQKHVLFSADELITTAKKSNVIVRAQQAISPTMLAFNPGLPLIYYEVLVKNLYPIWQSMSSYRLWIGWAFIDFSPNQGPWFNNYTGSYGINCDGRYHESDRQFVFSNRDGFRTGDVVGSGLLLTRDGQLNLFFTKNGRLNGKLIALSIQKPSSHSHTLGKKKDSSQESLLLYPTVCFSSCSDSVEANFGADPEKLFKFNINAYQAELFG